MGIHAEFQLFIEAEGELIWEGNFGLTSKERPKAIYEYDEHTIVFDLDPRTEDNTIVYITDKDSKIIYLSKFAIAGSTRIIGKEIDEALGNIQVLNDLLLRWKKEMV